MAKFKVGDKVIVRYTTNAYFFDYYPDFDKEYPAFEAKGTVEWVPQATGDTWHILFDNGEYCAINPSCSDLAYIKLVGSENGQ